MQASPTYRVGNETRPMPFGGDRAVARTIARVHQVSRYNPRRCGGCGELYPCEARRQADRVLDA